jgi:3D (Asp-Asp-Asp) domain-containing protein
MSEQPTNLELVQASTQAIQKAVYQGQASSPVSSPPSGGSGGNGASALDQSTARAVQSIGQTTAIVIQDAGDMLRNISTVETTAIGAATAAWIASEGVDVIYETIIDKGMAIMQQAADLYLKIGQNAYQVLIQFKAQS